MFPVSLCVSSAVYMSLSHRDKNFTHWKLFTSSCFHNTSFLLLFFLQRLSFLTANVKEKQIQNHLADHRLDGKTFDQPTDKPKPSSVNIYISKYYFNRNSICFFHIFFFSFDDDFFLIVSPANKTITPLRANGLLGVRENETN